MLSRAVRGHAAGLALVALLATSAGARAPLPAPGVSAGSDAADDTALSGPTFDAALPPLDATAAPEAASPPDVTTSTTPVAPDPELARPLPPIATFDATPPPAAPIAADEQAPRIRYAIKVDGLKAIGLDDAFRALSALYKDGRKAANAAQVGARAEEDVKLAERLMRAGGYYDALATAAVDPVDAQGVVHVTLTATPGPLYAFGSIAVTGAAAGPTGLAIDALALKSGDPILASAVETGEAEVALRLPERGYPFVTVGQRDILLDDATHTGDYTLSIVSGPKSSFGGFRTAGDPVFGVDHLAVFPRFRRGQLYDSRKVDDLRQALVATSLFSTIAVEPVATGTTAADGTEVVDLLVRQTTGPWHTLAGSAGYATGEGIKLTGSYTSRNAFPDEGALILALVAGTQEQSATGTFRRSNAGQRDRTLQAALSVARQRFDAYNAQTVDLSASLARQSTPIWQKRWTWSLGAEITATRETRFQTMTQDRTSSTYYIAALPLQLGYDRSNSLLDPTKGFRLTGRLSPEVQQRQGGGFDSYVRSLFEASGYYPVFGALTLAARARVGAIVGASRDDIAPSRRLYSGGGGSVRGFGYQQLGPKDADNNPVGGRSLTEFALEGRYRFGNFGVVPFVDAGRVGVDPTPSLSGLRYGAGIGGRYYTNFGPLRVDVATPLKRRPGESRIALYISIGQAF